MGYVISIIIITLAAVLIGGFIFMWVFCMKIAKKQYANMFIRDSKDKWARGNSAPDNPEHTVMFDTGMKWGNENASYMQEIEMTSFDGLKMKGEYFDFGFDRACLIMAGRAETCKYCYYFADLYQKNNYNIIVVDPRAAGLSEGRYTVAGMLEGKDVNSWLNVVHEKFGIDHFVIHGICIGSVAAIYTASEHNPYVDAIVLAAVIIIALTLVSQGAEPKTLPVNRIVTLNLSTETFTFVNVNATFSAKYSPMTNSFTTNPYSGGIINPDPQPGKP